MGMLGLCLIIKIASCTSLPYNSDSQDNPKYNSVKVSTENFIVTKMQLVAINMLTTLKENTGHTLPGDKSAFHTGPLLDQFTEINREFSIRRKELEPIAIALVTGFYKDIENILEMKNYLKNLVISEVASKIPKEFEKTIDNAIYQHKNAPNLFT